MEIAKRQNIAPVRQDAGLWSVLAKDHQPGTILPQHQHRTGQLVFAVSGVMQIETGQGRWTVPPQRALWVPPQQPHAIQMLSCTEMRTVYFQPPLIEQCAGFIRRNEVHALVAAPLIKELVLGLFDLQRSQDMRYLMVQLLLHALGETGYLPIYLPMPSDARLRSTLIQLIADNSWFLPIAEVACLAAMSERTFTRHFTQEVGLSFRVWRQRARIIASLDLLASNHSVKSIAHTLGFMSPAAYSAAFREILGCAPTMFCETGQRRA